MAENESIPQVPLPSWLEEMRSHAEDLTGYEYPVGRLASDVLCAISVIQNMVDAVAGKVAEIEASTLDEELEEELR